MVLKAGGKLTKRKDGKWILYISKKLADDSQWPFPEGTQEVVVAVNTVQNILIVSHVNKEGGEPSGRESD